MKKQKHDAFSGLMNWLENGDDALNAQMEETLSDDGADSVSRPDQPRAKKKAKKKAAGKKEREKSTEDTASWTDRGWYKILALLLCLSLIALLLYAAVRLPKFGSADTLVDSELTEFYVTHTQEETGALNIVTGIILDYRGFDTLGESNVLFIAVCTVLLLLSVYGEKNEKFRLLASAHDRAFEPRDDLILQCASRVLTPIVFVFGAYIILNGHLSPGGGFSGGAVLGAGLILYQNAFGYKKIEKFFTFKAFRVISVSALLFYSLAKGYHFFTGANRLESMIGTGTPGSILSGGLLLPLNIAVGCVVACTMYALYTMFRKGEF